MKKSLLPLFLIFLASCGTTNFYQVYKAKAEGGKTTGKEIVFEDEYCRVSYNLWSPGGNVGFSFYNKTDEDLTIDLSRTFFVLNGFTFDYFQDRVYSTSSSSGVSVASPYYSVGSNVARGTSFSSSTSYNEKEQRIVPLGVSVQISEFEIVESRYINCDLKKFPTRNKVKTISFDKSNSPFKFQNLITYTAKGTDYRMDNSFYVVEVTNYPPSMVVHKVYKSECGTNLQTPFYEFSEISADKFYLEYFMNSK
ncbi:MAG: hypothetical protein EYC69_03630 [Bacteroidetes bacterium]|nr:MAG: hypothetical protein EYC69_03630 [Bacteroidota bacterium]